MLSKRELSTLPCARTHKGGSHSPQEALRKQQVEVSPFLVLLLMTEHPFIAYLDYLGPGLSFVLSLNSHHNLAQ